MKIAVFHNLPSGGAKRALYNLVRQLVRMGNSADLYVPSTANETYLNMKPVVTDYRSYAVRSTFGSRIRTGLGGLPAMFAIQKTMADDINAGDYDVVLCEQDRYTYSPFLLRYLRKPAVFYCQQPKRANEVVVENLAALVRFRKGTALYMRPWKSYWTNWRKRAERENVSFASCVLANSHFSRENILRSFGVNAFVSYLGTDTSFFRPLSMSRENFVLTVGMCAPHKGFDFLIRSLSFIESSRRPRLLIVSNITIPPWESYLVQLAAKLGVQVEIRKEAEDGELVALYNRARVFVYAPYLEPFGLAPLEAMACGTPVVAVREGGVRESVLDGVTGILTERDEQDFAEALSDILSDRHKRRLLGENGVEAVSRFWTWGQAGERLHAHLRRALAQGPRSCNDRQTTEWLVPQSVR